MSDELTRLTQGDTQLNDPPIDQTIKNAYYVSCLKKPTIDEAGQIWDMVSTAIWPTFS